MMRKFHSACMIFLLIGFCAMLIFCKKDTTSEEEVDQMAEKNGMKEEPKMNIQKQTFGQMPDGSEVLLFTLTNATGLEAKVMTYGATLV